MKWRGSAGALINDDGRAISKEEAHERIRLTLERTGRFILGSEYLPSVGEISYFAGLPVRVVRLVAHEEAQRDEEVTRDIWETDGPVEGTHFYFEVEVAD